MMSWTVRPGQPGSIETERNRQVLQSHLLKELIVGALQKRGIDIHDRPDAGLGETSGKSDRMRFADPGVKKALREILADLFQLVSLAHGRRNDGDARILFHGLV